MLIATGRFGNEGLDVVWSRMCSEYRITLSASRDIDPLAAGLVLPDAGDQRHRWKTSGGGIDCPFQYWVAGTANVRCAEMRADLEYDFFAESVDGAAGHGEWWLRWRGTFGPRSAAQF